MQTLAEALGPLDAGPGGPRRAPATGSARFADLYEHYGPVIRAWTEAEIGSARVRPARQRRARPVHTACSTERIAEAAPDRPRPGDRGARARRDARAAQLLRAVAAGARRTGRRWSTRSPASPTPRCSAPRRDRRRWLSASPARTRACRSPSSTTGPEYATSPFTSTIASSAIAERVVHVLLDDQQRRARVADRLERAVHLVDDDRREPERQLVGDQQPRLLDEHARERRACAARRPRACPRPAGAARRAAGTARTPRRARRARRRAAAAAERQLEVLLRRSATRTPNGPRARARCRRRANRNGARR